MDALDQNEAAEAPDTSAEEAAPEAGEGSAAAGGADTSAEPDPTPTAGDPVPGGDTGGEPAGDSDADAGGDSGAGEPADAGSDGGDRAPAGTVAYSAVSSQLSELSTKFEETTDKAFQQQALQDVREEYTQFFDALKKHPRLLVGAQVPDLTSEDENAMETLRDAQDAKDWQEAVKSLLTEEIQDRARKAMEENSGVIDTVHQSIELFTKNKDLVPGTKEFNRRLADRFAAMAKPYELRVDGKLHGYTIPVQPLIDQLRTQIANEPKAAPPAAPAARGRPKKKADPPQRSIKSKAGSGDPGEDFSTLFGTLGLPDLTR
jgi:hypothetical protein